MGRRVREHSAVAVALFGLLIQIWLNLRAVPDATMFVEDEDELLSNPRRSTSESALSP
jgi:hypothetical protein